MLVFAHANICPDPCKRGLMVVSLNRSYNNGELSSSQERAIRQKEENNQLEVNIALNDDLKIGSKAIAKRH